MAPPAEARFPNFIQMTPRVPLRVWRAVRVASVASALTLFVLLFAWPRVGLFIFWGLAIPLLPLLWFVAPGLWRNVCPLAAVNQAPRHLGFTRGLTLPPFFQRYGYLIAVGLFLGIVPARKVLLNGNGPATAILLVVVFATAFAGGLAIKGKAGWCSTFCPLLPVQRVYGQTPLTIVRNSHCEPCVGCTRNCYDFNPYVAQIADLNDDDADHAAYRKLFVGAFPGFVLAYYLVDARNGWGVLEMYGEFGLFVLGSVGSFFLLDSLLHVTPSALAVLYGAAALNVYYWFGIPELSRRIADTAPAWLVWPSRALLLASTLVWVARSWRKEQRFFAEVAAPPATRVGKQALAAISAAGSRERPEVTILPEHRRLAVDPGTTLLDVIERSGLPIEAGCRMGLCGSDPICVQEGEANLSPVDDSERTTLQRLGLESGHRMACCARVLGPVALSPRPRPPAEGVAALGEAAADPSVRRVVVIGNGIAGITAADHARRNHARCAIDVVGRERHHLYNRMAITRLIHGRSAMQGLYLVPDVWYEQNRITPWLNTRATAIDRERQEVRLATGEVLPYDRLIIAAGSSSFVPPIEGFGAPGTFVLREAEDAMAIRSYVQERDARHAVVAGGGLLGLEAAYALHQFGLKATVTEIGDQLLRRQLDERGSFFLHKYLEALGLEVVLAAAVASVQTDGRVHGVTLEDGRELSCDLLLVSAGITPNSELAVEAGIAVGRGIVVDDHMCSGDPAVYAVGDAAEHGGAVWGLWPTAVEQGRVAGINAVGGDERYGGTLPVTMLKVTGVHLTSIGRFNRESEDETEIALEDPVETRYRKLVIDQDGKIAGAILLGYALEAPGLIAAVREGRDVTEHLDPLRDGDWSTFVAAGATTAEAAA
jgi:NADPH-dependent 2,4-dienoyl-CoA reductase/sulfur reductase-like enzyme/ferredoxin